MKYFLKRLKLMLKILFLSSTIYWDFIYDILKSLWILKIIIKKNNKSIKTVIVSKFYLYTYAVSEKYQKIYILYYF